MPKKAKEEIIENIKKDTKKSNLKGKTGKTAKTSTKVTAKPKKALAKNAKASRTKTSTLDTKSVSKAKTSKTPAKSTSKTKTNVSQAKSVAKTKTNKTSIKPVSKSKGKAVKKATKTSNKKKNIVEYYDLPEMYNQTLVKILAQTPKIIFVYWDISVEDKKNYILKYGQSFFDNTVPYLKIENITKNYTFEVEVNDYANSWYVHIPDSDCKYNVTLIRKYKKNASDQDYIYITSSNSLETPNDHILFEKLGKMVFFRNVNTNSIEQRNISSLFFMSNIGQIYNIYELYKELYRDELKENHFEVNFSSSKMSS